MDIGTVGGGRVGQFTTAVGGTGQGSLASSSIGSNFGVAVGRSPNSVAVGDIDGDGDLDFVAANGGSTARSVSVRVNTIIRPGGVYFEPHAVNPEVALNSRPSNVVLGDIDGDGDLDLLVSSFFDYFVYLRFNDGTGNFMARTANPDVLINSFVLNAVLGDVDGDGDLDLAAAGDAVNNTTIRLNDGFGRFSGGSSFSMGVSVYALALSDLDNDGDLDMLASNYVSGSVNSRFNDGVGGFAAPLSVVGVGIQPQGLALGDVDGDGDVDLAVANYGIGSASTTSGDTLVSLRLNDGSGVFTASALNAEIGVDRNPRGLAFGDLDGDGDLDLVVACRGGVRSVVRLNDGTGGFTRPRNFARLFIYGAANNLVLADVDGDGDLDALFTTENDAVQLGINGRASLSVVAAGAGSGGLFPNPAHTATTFSGAMAHAPITVSDAMGRFVCIASADAEGRALLQLPSGLAPGLYLVKSGLAVRRLMVE